MHPVRGLLYPTSYPRRSVRRHLAQIFAECTLMLPSGQAASELAASEEVSDIGLHPLVPVFSETEEEAFQHLTRDWMHWASDLDLGRVPGMGAFFMRDEAAGPESIQGILKSLKGGNAEDRVFSARLFLQLAFDLDRKDDELREDLSRLGSMQNALRDILQGDGERTGEPLRDGAVPPLEQARERTKAWTVLWPKVQTTGETLLPVGESLAVKDLLDTAHEGLKPGRPFADLLRLPLPADASVHPGRHEAVSSGLATLLEALDNLQAAEEAPSEVSRLAKEIEARWAEAMGPVPSQATCVLTFYPGTSWPELLEKATGAALPKEERPDIRPAVPWSFYVV